jgi:PD-(D/E)XK endonuclease
LSNCNNCLQTADIYETLREMPPVALSHHPVDVGQRSEAAILAAFVERGFLVWLPWSVNHRYDMLLDLGDRLLRIQCKTGRLRNGTILFNTRSVRTNRKQVFSRSYVGEIDYFAVYCPDVDDVFLIACEKTGRFGGSLRVDPAVNGQSKRIVWAADHRLERFAP